MERKDNSIKTQVAVSIVNFKAKEYLQKCLEDLIGQKTSAGVEIWVLDNNSQDGSAEMVSKKFPKVKLIKSEKNLGFAAGQTQILKKAQADYYLIVNPDTRISEDAVEKMIEFFKSHPACGVLSTRLVGFDGKIQSNGGDLPFGLALLSWLFNLEALGIKANFHRSDKEFYNSKSNVGWVGGTFMMIKKEVFDKIGFFNPDYFMYVEDVDLCYRAGLEGYKIMINPQVVISHKSGASSDNPQFYQWKSEFRNLILFYQKNFGLLSAILLKMVIYLSIFLRMTAFLLLGKGGESRTYAKIFAKL